MPPGDPSKVEFTKAKRALKDAFKASNDADEKARIRAAFDDVDRLEDAYDLARLQDTAEALTQAANRLQEVIDAIPVNPIADFLGNLNGAVGGLRALAEAAIGPR